MSAPSHKASFDHANLYASNMVLDDTSVGGGPIRRHRSMTPSHVRSNGDSVRRPGTANSGEFNAWGGTPGSVGGFGVSILENTATTEMYLRKRAEEPKKWECETVCELTVTPGEYFD